MLLHKSLGPIKRALSFMLVLSLTACGGSQSFEASLDEMWQWDGGVEATRVLSALEGEQAPAAIPAAVGVTGRGLVGRTLPDGKRWTYEGKVDVLPTLVGNLVIFSGDGTVTALDVTTGIKKYAVKTNDRRLEGAGYDGTHSILLLVDADDARKDQIVVLGPTGNELHSVSANARIGTPAAVGGVGLVPYSDQYVGAMDLVTGKHIGRLLVRDSLHTVQANEEGVILFGAGASLLDTKLTSSPDSRALKLSPRKLPGDPVWPPDGSKPRPARAAPVDIYAHVDTSERPVRFSGGGYIASYYEVLLGLDHGTNKVRWATHLPRAVTGGDAGPSGPVLCLENGVIVRVNAKTGHHIPFGSLETKVTACVVSSPSSEIPAGNPSPVLEQLEETICGTGPDMAAIQKVLLSELGRNKSAKTTKALLAIAQNPLVSADLSREAERLLRGRRKGGREMVKALLLSAPKPPEAPPHKVEPPKKDPGVPTPPAPSGVTPPESGEDIPPESDSTVAPPRGPTIDLSARKREKLRPPPVGALARALTRIKPKGAAGALAPYLGDPSLNSKSLLQIMEALLVLSRGEPEEVRHVSNFLYQYKNTGGEDALTDALVLAAHFLFKYGDEESNRKLQKDLDQSLTHPVLTAKLKKSPPSGDKPQAEGDTEPPAPKK